MKSIASRIDRLATRARESVCPSTIAGAVRAMTEELDPEAIPALIALLDHTHDAKESVRSALRRYGESAEGSLRAAAKDSPLAALILEEMALNDRFLQVGCF
jgi:hypothetical protein